VKTQEVLSNLIHELEDVIAQNPEKYKEFLCGKVDDIALRKGLDGNDQEQNNANQVFRFRYVIRRSGVLLFLANDRA
jgi:hypothetical protein